MPANDPSALFAAAFLAALIATTLMRLWLATRHARHVAAHRGAVPAAFAQTIPLAAHQRAADYTLAKIGLARIDLVVGALWTLALTLGGLIQWFSAALGNWFAPGGIAHGIALIGAVTFAGALVELPFAVVRTFNIEGRFGFNRMTPATFAADIAKSALLAVAIGGPLLFVVLWLMDRMGALWWLYVWAFWLAFNLLAMVLYPTLIAPLFNKFTPLADAALAARIRALLERCGFRASGLFVMDGSRRSAHGNAYFTGLGAAKRIVFFDTLIERLAPEEIEAVLAHELGHFRHRHIAKRIAWMALLSLAFLALLGVLIGQPWFYAGLGVAEPSTAAALLLFMIVVPVFTFPFAPIGSWLSRRHEFEADAYAAQQTRAGDLVTALVKLYRDNAATLTPDPLYSKFYDSHPPAATRIARLQGAPT